MINDQLLRSSASTAYGCSPTMCSGRTRHACGSPMWTMLEEVNGMKGGCALGVPEGADLSNRAVAKLMSDVVGTNKALFDMEQMTYH